MHPSFPVLALGAMLALPGASATGAPAPHLPMHAPVHLDAFQPASTPGLRHAFDDGDTRAVPQRVAFGGLARGDYLGMHPREIRAALRARGFHDIEIERDDDEWEVEADLGDLEVEIEISRRTGRITDIEYDD